MLKDWWQSEINEFQVVWLSILEDEVLSFDISMCDIVLVQESNSLQNLFQVDDS
jgi:hypothetical protein